MKRTLVRWFVWLALAPLVPSAASGSQGSTPPGTLGVTASSAPKLDAELLRRAGRSRTGRTTRVIITLQPGAPLPAELAPLARGRRLDIINGHVIDLRDSELNRVAALPSVAHLHYDRPVITSNYRTSVTVGADVAHGLFGMYGTGIGVAVIDSGLDTAHDDFATGAQVGVFVDFVNGHISPYDDNGHGTHVSGIIAGNGFDSSGLRAGIAPGATLVGLKVLGADGRGASSDIIAALDWVLANHNAYNIRVVNLSIGAGVYESYWTDPLTVAASQLVDAGIVVVAAAGNLGRTADGGVQYGGITAPANAPWVLTVGASSTMGTVSRADDTVAGYSSRGPTYLNWSAKPDLVAPGTGTESTIAPDSTLYRSRPDFLLPGTISTPHFPYLSLSGTSMAAPVVSGTVALMLEADPALTPNAVKAILQYTAETYSGYDALTQGAGFLNTAGAVRLARFFATGTANDTVPLDPRWSKSIIWGNYRLRGGVPLPTANAWHLGVTWGAFKGDDSTTIVWGQACSDPGCPQAVWSGSSDAATWGSDCGGGDCSLINWGTGADENENVVWSDDCGGSDCDNIVWGSDDDGGDNIVWGSDGSDDDIIWETGTADDVLWPPETAPEPGPGGAAPSRVIIANRPRY